MFEQGLRVSLCLAHWNLNMRACLGGHAQDRLKRRYTLKHILRVVGPHAAIKSSKDVPRFMINLYWAWNLVCVEMKTSHNSTCGVATQFECKQVTRYPLHDLDQHEPNRQRFRETKTWVQQHPGPSSDNSSP